MTVSEPAVRDSCVACVRRADGDRTAAVELLSTRATTGTDYLREAYASALDDLAPPEDDHR